MTPIDPDSETERLAWVGHWAERPSLGQYGCVSRRPRTGYQTVTRSRCTNKSEAMYRHFYDVYLFVTLWAGALPALGQEATAYLNVWLDSNRDGDWEDLYQECDGHSDEVLEHIVRRKKEKRPGFAAALTENRVSLPSPSAKPDQPRNYETPVYPDRGFLIGLNAGRRRFIFTFPKAPPGQISPGAWSCGRFRLA
jgi:hypothetical protein